MFVYLNSRVEAHLSAFIWNIMEMGEQGGVKCSHQRSSLEYPRQFHLSNTVYCVWVLHLTLSMDAGS